MNRMKLEDALSGMSKCVVPKLQNHSILNVIVDEDFYYPSPLIQTHSDPNRRVILFSAPGAVGKTSLAKHIAKQYGALYWNVALRPLSGIAFAGEITHAVGVGRGAQQDELYEKLKRGECMFVLDAFDEAALISRRDGIKDFIAEIGDILSDATAPSIIMTARTEMAQFIRSVCIEIGLGFDSYEIDYFEEEEASDFIVEYLKSAKVSVNSEQTRNIKAYIAAIKKRIGEDNNPKSFVGYAQVLRILARQIEVEIKATPRLDRLATMIQSHGGDRLVFDIIQHLITREQGKLEQFKASIRQKYAAIDKEYVVDSLYNKREQLMRLQFLVFTDSNAISDYAPSMELLPEDQDKYQNLLNQWLPDHVFLYEKNEEKKVMPIFGEYLLAESLLDSELELFTEEYQSKLPTRVFMDCYLSLNNGAVNSEHIYYLDLAFSSQAGMDSVAYCDISSIEKDDESDECLVLYLTLLSNASSNTVQDEPAPIRIIRNSDSPICLCRAENMSVNVEGKVVLTSQFHRDVTIRQSTIECDELVLDAPVIIFESYGEEENHVIVNKSIARRPGGKIIVKGTEKLKVELPADDLGANKAQFHEFARYLCSITADNDTSDCDDIEQFVHALKKNLEQFKVDRYDGDPAKHKEKIDARCHTGSKARVLAFLKYVGLIYEDGIMYKASLDKMDEMHISRVAYNHFNYKQLQHAYDLYADWFEENYA